jgi:hypothetical protein
MTPVGSAQHALVDTGHGVACLNAVFTPSFSKVT